MNLQHSRFYSAPWYPKGADQIPVMIGGAGGIGSWTSMLLARAGFLPIVYDFDLIEEHNIGGQLFAKSQIGMSKVEALAKTIKEYSDTVIIINNEEITDKTITSNFFISAFDNMKARKVAFTSWANVFSSSADAIFIDGRLNAEQMQIFCVRGGDQIAIDFYKNNLFSDEDIPDAPCTMKQTSHAAAMIASHIVGFFTNVFSNILDEDAYRSVPKKWEYFIPLDLITVTT